MSSFNLNPSTLKELYSAVELYNPRFEILKSRTYIIGGNPWNVSIRSLTLGQLA